MPVRQTGNWGPTPPAPAGFDYQDFLGDANLTPVLLQGLQSAFPAPWNTFSGPAPNWGWSVANERPRRNSSNGILGASRIWGALPWPLFARVPAVTVGQPPVSMRYRFDALMQFIPNNGIVDGAYLGLFENAADLGASAFSSGVQAEIDATGVYTTVRRRRVSNTAATTAPIAGAISALAPHVWSLEALFGPTNRLRMWLAGALVFEEERSDALQIPFGTSIGNVKGPGWGQPARPVTTLDGFWEYAGGRLRIDYV